MARNNRKLVPESRQMLDQMKYEIAAEFGIHIGGSAGVGSMDAEFGDELGSISGQGAYSGWGHVTSRENGSIGGEMTKRLVRSAESSAAGLKL
ncbi:alpha/beta-type small acid-soluble spore protein [Paenibacillus sp. Marseille-Q4541]|uniref:alpha/beta-type small acid-soluble spore protein n=1 Tax=Paenibacillus sp. Marseille-Q4541 TaxID=2831522 RepID=UPI001BA77D50|nr:alpha/beta-type small acid-soluble spore protein [Paenibacillus sp. Marseille-Q4541]